MKKNAKILIQSMATSVFVIMFTVLYAPFGYAEWMPLWQEKSSLSLPLLAAITLMTILTSRAIYEMINGSKVQNWSVYYIWQACEFSVIAMFWNLFLSLLFHKNYFDLLPTVALFCLLLHLFPYLIIGILERKSDTKKQLEATQAEVVKLQEMRLTPDSASMRFCDVSGKVKLVTSAERVLYIEAAGNYLNIIYDDDGRTTRCSLRNTLKGIEKLCTENHLVRCHRSYFVNVKKIKLLRRDHEFIYAQMNVEGVPDIPVSKTYAAEVIGHLN